ncbi:sensor c-di-GMP phosphodiesterase-like protein [Granulicella aggregans]|uniref:cyclic-guanylate-specific phosphodiesterase n=1 Tax=Granulicella aggregans TaxID=474949 RepID=A0A7W8E6R9_9BACT|nr:EAL domain-containing protein [Granulicella aggregans]MBB5060962.1 sensor c-di-GMP phosphodiesterase-like protein [Granulicella aggregans]
MNKTTVVATTLFAALFAISLPILIALYFSNREALDQERKVALSYARDVTHRNESIGDQVVIGLGMLASAHAKDPCSEDNIERMREANVSSSRVRAFGVVAGNRLICSSFGSFGAGLDLGNVAYSTPYPAQFRYDIEFPSAMGSKFVVVESNGYAAFIDSNLLTDWKLAESDASIMVISTFSPQSISLRGNIRPEWIGAKPDLQETTFLDNGFVVAIARSSKYRIGTVVALPTTHVTEKTKTLAMILVPVGTFAGLVLALAIMYLGRVQLALPAVIRTALRRNEFFLVYQPMVELSTGRWVGAEALIRWKRPNGELVSPELFIAVAEEAGLIQRITERVLELLAEDAKDLFQRYPDVHVSINLSPADLHSERTLGSLQKLARELKAGPGNLIVEATERGIVKAEEAIEVMGSIRTAGIQVAIDDFGTGYSSLSYLESFEVDFLKIDRSFVKSVATEAATSHVADHIIDMAKALKLSIIAEGVETEAQAQYLRDHGVKFAQGYLYAKPMAFSDFAAQLECDRGL